MNNLRYLLKRLDARGIRGRSLLAGTGVQISDLESPGYKPSVMQYCNVLRKIIEASPPGIGISMGLETTIGEEGILGYAALSSATLSDVRTLIRKYRALVEDFTVFSDEVVHDEWHIEFAALFPMGDLLPFLMEDLFARSKVESAVYTGVDIPLKRLDLAYPEPHYGRLYREIFRCPVHFNQARNLLVRDAQYLDLPIVFSNPEVRRLCEAQCAKLLGVICESSVVGKVSTELRGRLLLSPGKCPSLTEMSSAMSLSVTSLKRRLREEGATYQGLLDTIRKELAFQFLVETEVAPKEIGYRLGFSNVHNFRRAFKVWTGTSPSHFRSSGKQYRWPLEPGEEDSAAVHHHQSNHA